MDTIKLGIIGCANIVEKNIISALNNVRNAKLTAIASRNEEKAKNWAKRFGCEYEKSYDDVIKRKDVDAIYIPLPVGKHREWAIKAAKAKKHVLCEKSLAESFASVKQMVEACKDNNVFLYEDFMCDYHPQHHKVVSVISDGKIGSIFLFRGFFGFPPLDGEDIRYKKALGGGSLNDAGSYPVFMSRKILQSEPLYVTCSLVYDRIKGVDIQGSAQLEFPKNKAALVAFGFNNVYQNDYSVWGSSGLIEVKRAYTIPPDMKPRIELIKQGSTEKIDAPSANHFSLIFEDFCSSIIEGKKCNYSRLILQARVMEALRISSKENRKVAVADIN